MAVKTSLQVKTFNPVTNKNVTKTATYSNPNATDAQLNSFAQNFYGGLSDNTVNSVIRVDKQNITNAQPYALWTPSAEYYDINNGVFLNILYYGNNTNVEAGKNVVSVSNLTPVDTNNIQGDFTFADGTSATSNIKLCSVLVSSAITMTATDANTGNYKRLGLALTIGSFYVNTTGLSMAEIAVMLAQNKSVQFMAQYLDARTTAGGNLRRINVSYVPETNSIRIEPVEGITDDWYVIFKNPNAAYDSESQIVYSDGQVLGHNTTVNVVSDNEVNIIVGIKSHTE